VSLSALSLLGRFGDRLSLGARREISNVSPVPLARRVQSWRMPGLGRAEFIRQMETYSTDAVVYPIVERLFTAVGEAEWQMWNKTPGQQEEDRTPASAPAALAALDLVNDAVPGLITGSELHEAGQQHNELTGETNIIVGRTAGIAYPTDLWPCRPDRLEPVPRTDGYLAGWVYTSPDGERLPLENEELLRHKRPNPLDPYRGMGPIQALLLELDSQRYGKEWQAQFFQNSARPGGVIEIEKRLDDTEFDEMRDRWAEQHQGMSKAHRVAILENGAKWVETAFSFRDLQMVEMDAGARDKTLVAFGFPKSMLGIVEDVNRANAEAGEYVFARWLTVPRLKKWRAMWNKRLLPLYGPDMNKRFELDFVSPIPKNSEVAIQELEAKSTALVALTGGGFDAGKVLDMLEWPDLGYTAPPPPTIVAPPNPSQGDDEPPKPNAQVRASTQCGRSISGMCLEMTEGGTPCAEPCGVDAAMRWKVQGHDDGNACEDCRNNFDKLYRSRAAAYADYPGGQGYIKCIGAQHGNKCRCKVVKRRGQ
jgi:HK97 family phage portal protein